MRLYEFKCKDCGKRFEEWANRPEDVRVCPHCKSKNITRLYSADISFKFVGSGFYENDYKHKG